MTDLASLDGAHLKAMLQAGVSWLETNGAANKIEKWFFFTPWKDIVNVGGDGYMGTILFPPQEAWGPRSTASANCTGRGRSSTWRRRRSK